MWVWSVAITSISSISSFPTLLGPFSSPPPSSSYSFCSCILSRPQEAQEVPISPLLQLRDTQTTADLNLSFHGKTPVKSTSKVPPRLPTLPSPPPPHTHTHTFRTLVGKLDQYLNYKL